MFETAVVIRAAVLVWCVVPWVREPSRSARGRRGRSRARDRRRTRERVAARLRDGLRPCLVVFLAARIGLSLLSVVAVGLIEPLDRRCTCPGGPRRPPTPGWHNAIDATERQDAVWYLRLADDGWSRDDASAAFFPLYPLTVRAVAWVLPGRRRCCAALLVSNLAFLGALLALFALTAEAFGDRVARRAIVVAAIFPTAFFFLAPVHGVAVPVPVDPRVPGGAARPMGTRRRLRARSRPSPAASACC